MDGSVMGKGIWMSSAKMLRALGAALLVVLGASACGGSDGSGGGSVVDTKLSCTEQFNPDKAAAGDNCQPTYGAYCPDSGSGSPLFNDSEVTACDGVTVTSGTVEANGLSSDYVVLKPANGSGNNALYIALHWALANGETMANRMRMAELAKSRNVTVVLPTAPGSVLNRTWGRSAGIPPAASRADRVALIDALIAQTKPLAKASTPVLIAGVSGGAVLSFEYACDRAENISGAIVVAGEIPPDDLSSCAMAKGVATVQVHGTSDLIGPYDGNLLYASVPDTFAALQAQNGCDSTAIKTASLPTVDGELPTGYELQWVTDCSSGKGSALLTVDGGGHNWPGYQGPLDQLPISLFGAKASGFDTTLQGYDLLRYLGG